MLKKILQELILIRKELQVIRRNLELQKESEQDNQKIREIKEVVNCMIKNANTDNPKKGISPDY